jgi:hypothetical protein
MAQEPLVGQGLLVIVTPPPHSETPHSVGLLWTRDQSNAETSTRQPSQKTTIHSPSGIRTHNPSKRKAADPRLRPPGQWDLLLKTCNIKQTCWEIRVSNPAGVEIVRTRPERPWGPPSLPYSGYWVSFSGLKRPGSGTDHSPPSSTEIKGRVERHLYSPSGPSWPVLG